MPTRILVFNPLAEDEVVKLETELDALLNRGWKIISSIGCNRSGRQKNSRGPLRTEREVSARSLISNDYVVLILRRRVKKMPSGSTPEESLVNPAVGHFSATIGTQPDAVDQLEDRKRMESA